MTARDEWSEWSSVDEWERFVLAFNGERKPKPCLRDYAIRNLIVGFIAGVVMTLWLR